MTKAEKAIEKAYKAKCKLATAYNIEITSIIWMGGNKFIVVDNGIKQYFDDFDKRRKNSMFIIVLMLYLFAGVCEDIWLQIKK